MPEQKRDFIGGILDRFMGRTAPPPRPQPPSLPKPAATATPGTPQYALTKAQDDARNNPAFKPREGKTFCNRATCEIVKQMKGPMGALTYLTGDYAVANDAGRYLAIEAEVPTGSWRKVLLPAEAQRLANEGIVVVGVQRNTGKDKQGRQKHGHMATVRPESMPGFAANMEERSSKSGEPKAYVPIVNNIGGNIAVESADTAFPDKNLPVHYYAPRRR